jgi:hypothetical protein
MVDAAENGDLPEGQLSDKELKAVRRIIRDDDRARFFWRTLRVWGTYLFAAIGSIYASWDVVIRFVKTALGVK